MQCWELALAAASPLAVLPLLYRWGLSAPSPAGAWARMRLLALASIASLILLGLPSGGLGVESVGLAAALVVAVQAAMIHFLDRRVVAVSVYGFAGRSHVVRIIDSGRPAAFSTALGRRVYATTALLSAASPEEAAAIVAHEVGHGEAFRPLPPALVLSLVALGAAASAETVLLLAPGCPAAAAAAAASTVVAWVLFNWAWEHLADVYSLAAAGPASLEALGRLTGSQPCPPPGLPGLLWAALRSAWPRRGPRGVLVNPHPPPCLRLWLLGRLLGA